MIDFPAKHEKSTESEQDESAPDETTTEIWMRSNHPNRRKLNEGPDTTAGPKPKLERVVRPLDFLISLLFFMILVKTFRKRKDDSNVEDVSPKRKSDQSDNVKGTW